MDTVTLVVDQLPWPPRNGITLPVFNYIEQLRRTHRVELCLLQAEGAEDQTPWLAENIGRYGIITRLPLKRRGKLARIAGELAGREMLQHGWTAVPVLSRAAQAAIGQVVVAPISALAKWRAVRRVHPALQPRVTVAAVNDCTAAEYRYRSRSTQGDAAQRFKAWLDGLRTPLVARVEAGLLAEASAVLLQTEADLQAMRELVGPATAARCLLAPNGVRADYFDIRPVGVERVLFVAELSGEYDAIAHWLCTQVWPRVHAARPQASLLIVGRGARPALRELMAGTPGVQHLAFAPDLATVYADAGLAWSPVFKGFGLINKTLEAMACGLPVVGGVAAFNGIPGFSNGLHGLGLPAPDAGALAEATLRLLAEPARREAMGWAARELVRGPFQWSRCGEVLRQALAGGPRSSAEAGATEGPALARGG